MGGGGGGGGAAPAHPLHPPPRSAPEWRVARNRERRKKKARCFFLFFPAYFSLSRPHYLNDCNRPNRSCCKPSLVWSTTNTLRHWSPVGGCKLQVSGQNLLCHARSRQDRKCYTRTRRGQNSASRTHFEKPPHEGRRSSRRWRHKKGPEKSHEKTGNVM